MKPYLLDVNVLIALGWPSHVHHEEAQNWFAEHRQAGFRTCPLTETGFVRISSNPRFTPEAVSAREALALLERMIALPEHEFWPDDITVKEALVAASLIAGHRQITDAYLMALAARHGGILATLDRAVLTLPNVSGHVELIGQRTSA